MSEQMGLSVSFFCCGQARPGATAAQLMEGRQTSSLSSGYFRLGFSLKTSKLSSKKELSEFQIQRSRLKRLSGEG